LLTVSLGRCVRTLRAADRLRRRVINAFFSGGKVWSSLSRCFCRRPLTRVFGYSYDFVNHTWSNKIHTDFLTALGRFLYDACDRGYIVAEEEKL